MRIDSGYPLRSSGEVERTQKKGVQHQASAAEGVTGELSSDTVRLSSLEATANSGPEIRQAKVASLRSSIEAGTYEVSDAALADAILRDVLRRS